MNSQTDTKHQTVLLKETIDGINAKDGYVIVDGTLGAGGHSLALCEVGLNNLTIIGIDADLEAIERSRNRLKDSKCKTIFAQTYNHQFDKVLAQNDLSEIDGFILDLGFSSDQIETSRRGFSFQKDEPLLMTMKKDLNENDLTASEIVNNWEEESLADIIFGFGEERYARRIAKGIVIARKEKPIETTFQLIDIIKDAVPKSYSKGRLNPATKTFQALRIAVNNELENLKITLKKAFSFLSSGGRIAVISFHSLEDRIVKRFFRDLEKNGVAKRINKKPITASAKELSKNIRARSAKLRIIEKL